VDSGRRPRRADALEVSEVVDGLVVYQADPDRVHYLNNTAAVVFELCTGDNTEAEIAELVGRAYGLDEPPRREVASCLEHLQLEGIVR
jgi:hypothetical protein